MPRQHRLAPALHHRLSESMRPNWARTVLARRIAAAALLVLAAALFVRGDPNTERTSVVVAHRDLAPGRVLSADDVTVVDNPAATLPAGALREASDVIGRTLAGAVRDGEMLTDVAVLGPRLAAAAVGSADSRVVPVRLADPGVAELLREGDRVDVVTADDRTDPTTLATDAAVVLVARTGTERASSEPVVMLALPLREAGAVAGASLTKALTVILH